MVATVGNQIKTKPEQLQLAGATNKTLYILSANNKYMMGS